MKTVAVPRRHDRHSPESGTRESHRVGKERRNDRLRGDAVEPDPTGDRDVETRRIRAKTRVAARVPWSGECPQLRPSARSRCAAGTPRLDENECTD